MERQGYSEIVDLAAHANPEFVVQFVDEDEDQAMEDQPRPADDDTSQFDKALRRSRQAPLRYTEPDPNQLELFPGQFATVEHVPDDVRISVTRKQAEWLAEFLFSVYSPKLEWSALSRLSRVRLNSAVTAGLARLGVDVEWEPEALERVWNAIMRVEPGAEPSHED